MRQGRTDAWIAHQLEVSVGDIRGFKREHGLAPADAGDDVETTAASVDEEPDLRAEDEALVAAALEAELEAEEAEEAASEDEDEDDADAEAKPRRRGRRGGRGRRKGTAKTRDLEGTFDHGDEGYGLWLDPAVQDDPVYAEHWAGHRPVVVTVEADRIVIVRAGEEPESDSGSDPDSDD